MGSEKKRRIGGKEKEQQREGFERSSSRGVRGAAERVEEKDQQ